MAGENSPNRVIQTARSNSRFGQYRFPSDLGPNAMVIDFQEYSYARTTQAVSQTARTKTSIILPLPQQLTDSYDINVQQADLGVLGAAAVGLATSGVGIGDAIKGAFNQFGDAVESTSGNLTGGQSGITEALSNISGYAKFASRNVLDQFGPGLSLASDVIRGDAINPHTTLNFDGIGLKQFQFSWQLAPRNEKESDELKNIIEKFKSHILPKYSTLTGGGAAGNQSLDRALLKYPDLALIRLNGVNQNHFVKFQPGMISNFTVDYTPQGNVLVEGGKPAIVNISFTLQEAQIRVSGQAPNTQAVMPGGAAGASGTRSGNTTSTSGTGAR